MRLVHVSFPSASASASALLMTGMLTGALSGCAAESPSDATSSVALSSARESAFLPYVGLDVVAQRVPTTALYPDNSSYNSSLWVGIEVDGRVHELTDPPRACRRWRSTSMRRTDRSTPR